MFDRLWNYLSGYVIIKVEGLSLERFLNLALESGIRIRDAKRVSSISLRVKVRPGAFNKLHKALSQARCRLTIEKKVGLPFFFSRMGYRKVLLYGTLVAVAALILSERFVWTVEVTGAQTVEADAIIAVAEENGAGFLAPKWKLNRDSLANAVTASDKRIAWAACSYKGVKLIIEVVEGALPPEIIDQTTPANIVAEKDAVVKSLTVLEGVAAVKEGAAVRAGEVLISGEFTRVDRPPRYVRARGAVIGRVWYTGEATVMEHQSVMERTGRSVRTQQLSIAEWEVIAPKPEFEHYESEFIGTRVLGRLFIPLYSTTVMHYELKEREFTLNATELQSECEKKAAEDAAAKVPKQARIVETTLKFYPIAGGLQARAFIETEEPIGLTTNIEWLDQ